MTFPTHLPLTTPFGDTPNTLQARLTAAAVTDLPHGICRTLTDVQATFTDYAAAASTRATRRVSAGRREEDWETLHAGAGWMAVVAGRGTTIELSVQATTAALAEETLDDLAGSARPTPPPDNPDEVVIEFCHAGGRGVVRTKRLVTAPLWEQVRENYSHPTRQLLSQLCSVQNPAAGRLVLLWGEPGTGKTTAVRALAREWAPWCSTSYVLDPEALFGSSEYFHDLALGHGTSGRLLTGLLDDIDDTIDTIDDGAAASAGVERPGGERQKWRLLVVEDADELIASDAKLRTGQALSRLLNLTDGIVGQGTRTIVLITTNEPLSALHPALSRPGRCLARLEIAALNREEATRWLSQQGAPHLSGQLKDGTVTLAELYGMLTSSSPLLENKASHEPPGYL